MGLAVTCALLRRGIDVVALSRQPAAYMQTLITSSLHANTGQIGASSTCTAGRLHCVTCAIDQTTLTRDAVGILDAVISCLGSRSGALEDAQRVEFDANRRLLDYALSLPTIHRFVLLSAICVQKPKLAFQHQKLRFESLLRDSPVPYAIVRPTAYFKSLSGQVERLRAGKPYLMFGDGELTACKPIADIDLAQYIADCLMAADKQDSVLPIGGPGPALNPRQQGMLLATALGVPFKSRSINPNWFASAAAVLERLAPVSKILSQRAEFLRIAHYYATESMLCWDDKQGIYRADATPEYGSISLDQHYRQLAVSTAGSGLDDSHKLFS